MTKAQTDLLIAVANALKGAPSSSGMVWQTCELSALIAVVKHEAEVEAVAKAYRERT